mmetsp:Transcript_4527/g.6865  ORF Transcript_4527/g.6865 Transcript_4527/m.6865 type:complete len:303 (-) Transcript_4527:742-1650(-)
MADIALHISTVPGSLQRMVVFPRRHPHRRTFKLNFAFKLTCLPFRLFVPSQPNRFKQELNFILLEAVSFLGNDIFVQIPHSFQLSLFPGRQSRQLLPSNLLFRNRHSAAHNLLHVIRLQYLFLYCIPHRKLLHSHLASRTQPIGPRNDLSLYSFVPDLLQKVNVRGKAQIQPSGAVHVQQKHKAAVAIFELHQFLVSPRPKKLRYILTSSFQPIPLWAVSVVSVHFISNDVQNFSELAENDSFDRPVIVKPGASGTINVFNDCLGLTVHVQVVLPASVVRGNQRRPYFVDRVMPLQLKPRLE